MKSLRALFCLSLLAVASVANAQDTNEPNAKFFKDFNGVTALLRASGVEPSRLQWGVIETVCAPYNDYKKPAEYNRCRFEKARDQAYSGVDANACNSAAVAAYPDILLTKTPTNVVRYRNGVYSTTTIENPATSISDLNALRSASYDACMTGKGWRDPHNYIMGRTN